MEKRARAACLFTTGEVDSFPFSYIDYEERNCAAPAGCVSLSNLPPNSVAITLAPVVTLPALGLTLQWSRGGRVVLRLDEPADALEQQRVLDTDLFGEELLQQVGPARRRLRLGLGSGSGLGLGLGLGLG